MPFNFHSRVEAYVGEVTDTGALTDWLCAGARRLIDLMPIPKAQRMATSLAIPAATPTDISQSRVLGVYKSGYEAARAPLGWKTDLGTAGSMRNATARSPSYIIENQLLSIYPTSGAGTAEVVAYPREVMFSDDSIPNFPSDGEELVVVYAAIQYTLHRFREDVEALAGIALANPTAVLPPAVVPPAVSIPAAPSLATVTYQVVNGVPITGASIGTVTVPSAPTLPALGSIAPYLNQSKSWPANFDAFLTAELDTNQDVELMTGKLNQAQTMLQKYQAEVNEESARVGSDARRYEAESTYLRAQTDLFGAEIQAYTAEVQKAIQQAQLEQQVLLEAAKSTNDISLQNSLRTMEATISNNRSLLEKYSTEMRAYEAAMNAFAAEVQAYASQAQVYASEVQKLLGYFNAEIARYIARQSYWDRILASLSRTYRDGLTMWTGGIPGDDKANA